LFGVWGSAADLWLVGGVPNGRGVVLRGDVSGGAVSNSGVSDSGLSDSGGPSATVPELARVDDLPEPIVSGYFKVWGRSPDEVRIVGADGVVIEYDGSSLELVETGSLERLLTVHGSDSGYTAVGGLGRGLVLDSEQSGEWRDATPPESQRLLGVYRVRDRGWAVGARGTVLERRDGAWQHHETGLDVSEDLHTVWEDPEGGVWAVGGSLTAPPLVDGTLVYRGPKKPSSEIVE
jgi:hypothetical protein